MAEGEKLIPINIEEEMKSAYIDYSMSCGSTTRTI